MADFSIFGELGINTKPFENSMKKVESTAKNFSNNFSNIGKKISDGSKNWGLDLGKFYDTGSGIFKKFGLDIDKFASHFGMSGKLMSAIVATTSALVKLGQEMDEMTKQIALGTGAIGDELDRLEESSYNALVNGVGKSVQETGKIIADLNTRFAVTGDSLTDLTVKFGKFSNVTSTDVSTSINSVADTMKRWNIDTEDTGKLLDQITKATQISGISMSELTSELNSSSTSFQQFGFSATETIAMLSSFKQNGIQTQTVLNGMKIAMAKFSAEGKNAKQAFNEIAEAIKNADSDTEAMRIAIENFGSKSGPEMVKAFRDGTSSVEDYTSALRMAGGTLEKTNEASRTSKDAMADLKNALKGTFGEFGQGFSQLWKGILDGITNFVRMIAPIIQPIGDIFKTIFSTIGDAIAWLTKELKTFVMNNNSVWKAVTGTLSNVAKSFKKLFGNFFAIFKNVFGAIFAILRGDWAEAWLNVKLIAGRIAKGVLDIISTVWNGLKGFINLFINGINKILEGYNKVAEFFGWGTAEMISDLPTATDLAESTGLNAWIAETQAQLDALRGDEEEIGDLGSVAIVTNDFEGVGFGAGSGAEAKNTTAWTEKVLQQKLDAITKEKEEKLKALAEEGKSQEELDKINLEYAEKQIYLNSQIADLKKSNDLESLKSSANFADEKIKLEEYYATEANKYADDVKNNKIKAMGDETQWKEKLLNKEIELLKNQRDEEIKTLEESGATYEQMQRKKVAYNEKIIQLYNEMTSIQKKNDLASVRSAEEKARVEQYYALQTAEFIDDLNKETFKKIEKESKNWFSGMVSIFQKIGPAIGKAVQKGFSFIKNVFSKMWDFMKQDPDKLLDNMLEVSDTILTFISNIMPNLPAFMDAFVNVIEAVLDVLLQDSTINMFLDVVIQLIEKVINLIVNNMGRLIRSFGKLVGGILSALIKCLVEVDWIEFFKDVLGAIWDAIVSIIQGIFGQLGNVLSRDNQSSGSHIAKGILGLLTGGLSFIATGFATGTNNAPSGLHIVGEQGPELIDFHGGERVYNADSTRDIMSSVGGGGNNFNVTFNNLQDTSAYSMMKQLKQYQREMAINGVI